MHTPILMGTDGSISIWTELEDMERFDPNEGSKAFLSCRGDEWTRSANGNASSDRKKIVLAGAPCQIMGLIL